MAQGGLDNCGDLVADDGIVYGYTHYGAVTLAPT